MLPLRFSRPALAAALALGVATGTLEAQAFGFEGVAPGVYTTLTATSGAQSLTVTAITPGGDFRIFDLSAPGLGPPLQGPFGDRGLFADFTALRFAFAQPVVGATFQFADYANDADSPVILTAFSAGGTLLGTFTATYGAGVSTTETLTATGLGAGASYFEFSSGAGEPTPNTLYVEVQASTVATVPEPATVVLVAGGLLGVGAVARRRRTA